MTSDTEDLPVLKDGRITQPPNRTLNGLIWVVILLVIALCALSSAGCAIPVRPIAKTEVGKDGLPHFIPDPEQEPQIAEALPWLAKLAQLAGPYGDVIALALTALGPALITHQHHKRKAEKTRPKSVAQSVAMGGSVVHASPQP